MQPSSRLDCYPEPGANQAGCAARGCCWGEIDGSAGIAFCYHPHKEGYQLASSDITGTNTGISASLTWDDTTRGPYGSDPATLTLDVYEETDTRLRFRITDPSTTRHTVPGVVQAPTPTSKAPTPQYNYTLNAGAGTNPGTFGITVARRDSGEVLFDSTPPTTNSAAAPRFNGLLYENQFLEISTSMPEEPVIYGLGEHITPLALATNYSDGAASAGQVYTLLARDQGTPDHNPRGGTNLYASHPFFMVVNPSTGSAHGVFLLNSNAMDVVVQPGALTYRITGGILDFYIFTGPSPEEVVMQYHEVIGTPYLPPYWALGYNLCRWGYCTLTRTSEVNNNLRNADIPQDVQWNDIDYMHLHYDFTSDPTRFPLPDFSSWVDSLHQQDQRYVQIYDPGIPVLTNPSEYPPYESGLEAGVYINTSAGVPYDGAVWPGETVWPDFLNPATPGWWKSTLQMWHDKLAYDGMWIDMNEPSNFCNGPYNPKVCGQPESACPDDYGSMGYEEFMQNADLVAQSEALAAQRSPPVAPRVSPAPVSASSATKSAGRVGSRRALRASSTPTLGSGFDPLFPPYIPGHVAGDNEGAFIKTMMFDAVQYPGLHYDWHNMYGHSEIVASADAMKSITGERQMIISRSTFPGSGFHGGHWLGDNTATWDDLYYSIPGTLSMNIFGIPLVGADTCGFNSNTTPELCSRWTQVAVFYGFMRNHNGKGFVPQDPASFPDPYQTYMRDAIRLRYTLLPYLYTQFFRVHLEGGMVLRPLSFAFPSSLAPDELPKLDKQWMMGPGLMVSPVLTEGATTVSAFFPSTGQGWYDWFNGTLITANNTYVTLDADLGTLPVHIRGGEVVATQDYALTSVQARTTQWTITAALDQTTEHGSEASSGYVIVDNGTSLTTIADTAYTNVTFSAGVAPSGAGVALCSSVPVSGYTLPSSATIGTIRIFGAPSTLPASPPASCNGASASSVSVSDGVVTVECGEGVALTAELQVVVGSGTGCGWK